MAISEFETRRCEKLMGAYIERHRPPAHLRNQLDLACRISDQSIEIFEIRPLWDKPEQKIEEMVAKTTFVKKSGLWKVYWQRADMKWHSYKPKPEVHSLEEFLALVEKDEHGCFYG
jgi:Protein of unknown function (DUF3024)